MFISFTLIMGISSWISHETPIIRMDFPIFSPNPIGKSTNRMGRKWQTGRNYQRVTTRNRHSTRKNRLGEWWYCLGNRAPVGLFGCSGYPVIYSVSWLPIVIQIGAGILHPLSLLANIVHRFHCWFSSSLCNKLPEGKSHEKSQECSINIPLDPIDIPLNSTI